MGKTAQVERIVRVAQSSDINTFWYVFFFANQANVGENWLEKLANCSWDVPLFDQNSA